MFDRIIKIFLVLSSTIFSQVNLDSMDWVIVDSIVYESQQKPLPYPFDAQIDSAKKEFSIVAQKYYDEGAFCVYPPTEKPILFGVKDGKVVSLDDYKNESKKIFPDSCLLIFEIDIDWRGNISRAKLRRYKGNAKLERTLDDFFSNIKAIPSKYADIPQNAKVILPIRNSDDL